MTGTTQVRAYDSIGTTTRDSVRRKATDNVSLSNTLTIMKRKGKLKGKKKGLSAEKAKMMLHDNSAQGHPLTSKQRGLFGLIASGKYPTKASR